MRIAFFCHAGTSCQIRKPSNTRRDLPAPYIDCTQIPAPIIAQQRAKRSPARVHAYGEDDREPCTRRDIVTVVATGATLCQATDVEAGLVRFPAAELKNTYVLVRQFDKT